MAWHGHKTTNVSIELEWIDVLDVPMLWTTYGFVLDDMTKWAAMTDDTPWLGMMSRNMNHVNWEPKWHDGMQCCIERPCPQVEVRSSWMTWWYEPQPRNFHTSRSNYKDKSQEVTTSFSHLHSSYGELVKEKSRRHCRSSLHVVKSWVSR